MIIECNWVGNFMYCVLMIVYLELIDDFSVLFVVGGFVCFFGLWYCFNDIVDMDGMFVVFDWLLFVFEVDLIRIFVCVFVVVRYGDIVLWFEVEGFVFVNFVLLLYILVVGVIVIGIYGLGDVIGFFVSVV